MKPEVELKYNVTDFEQITGKLIQHGAQLVTSSSEECNIIFDTSDRQLSRAGKLLRLRSYAGKIMLTVKNPVIPGQMKSRDEFETSLSSGMADSQKLLEQLGYIPVYRYSKIRELWNLQEAHICLDTLPFGCFVEIEAVSTDMVRSVSELLGYEIRNGSKLSYRDLEKQYKMSTEDAIS